MMVGTLQAELYLPGTTSLKEKRFVLKSMKTRMRNKFNVSVAEVDHQDKWQRTLLGVAAVANERRFLDETLTKVMNLIEREDRVELIDHAMEIL